MRRPQFSAHVYCGKMVGWIKMALGMEVGLGPCHILLDRHPAILPKRGQNPQIFGPCLLWPNGWMHQDATWYGMEVGLSPGDFVRCRPTSPSKKAAEPPIFAHVYCDQTAGWIKMPLGTEVGPLGLGPGNIYVRWDPAPPPKRATAPQFSAGLLWSNGCMYQDTNWYGGT